MRYPSFCGPTYRSQSIRFDQERTINWYPVPSQTPGTTSNMALFPTPGVETIGTAGTGAGRAHLFEDGREWAVIGSSFVEIDIDGTRTSKGTVATDQNPATISSNGDGGGELFITSGGNGYIYDLAADTLTQIAALNGIADYGGQLDGFFLALDASTGTLHISELLDGTTWDATQIVQRSSEPDPWIAMRVVSPYIYLLGTQTSDIWYNAGTSPFPFAAHPSGQLNYGIVGAFAGTDCNGDLVWIGQSRIGEAMVLRASGFAPERIETYPIAHELQKLTRLDEAIGDGYEEGGHVFALLSVPDSDVTWAYDLTTGMWHERGTWISEDRMYQPIRIRHHAFAFGENRWLDSETGALYRSSTELFRDVDDREIRRLRRAPALQYENQRIFYNAFELVMDTGIGTLNAPTLGSQAIPSSLFADASFWAYWELESSGVDENGGTSNLTGVNSPTYAPAVRGNGAQLPAASTQYFEIASGSATNFDLGTDDATIGFKVRFDSLASAQKMLAEKGAFGGTDGWNFRCENSAGNITIGLNDDAGNATTVTSTATVSAGNTFYILVATIDRTNDVAKIYINEDVASGDISSITGNLSNSGRKLTIGAPQNASGGITLDGRIDQVVFLKGVAWTASQVATYADRGLDQGVNPQVMLRMSDDGGRTWGPELWESAGKIGEYNTRVRWNRLGMATQRVVEVVVSDPVPWRIVDATLDIRQPPRGLAQRTA